MERDKRETWSALVNEWRRSGLTAKAFATRHRIKPTTLAWWKWKLGSEPAPKASRGASEALTPLTFVEMTAPLRGEPLEVVLPSGVRIRVPVDFDAVALGRLLDVLGEHR